MFNNECAIYADSLISLYFEIPLTSTLVNSFKKKQCYIEL